MDKIKLTPEEMRDLGNISKYETVSGPVYAQLITYKALPYPLPEKFQKQLKACGRWNGEAPAGDIVELYKLEKKMRDMFGVYITRPFIQPRRSL